MRREWSPWIKTRQWHEFERLAKTDPSQPLADTVAELERGFPEKSDRRALRKVLYLLARAGYQPQEIEEAADAPLPEPTPASPEVGFMLSPDHGGGETLAYGKREGRKMRWLFVDVIPGLGIFDAAELEEEETGSSDRIEARLKSNLNRRIASRVSAEYVAWRIADEASRTSRRLPATIAFWRTSLPAASVMPHPGESLPRADSVTEIAKRLGQSAFWCVWRFELGSAAKVLEEFHAAHATAESDVERPEMTELAKAAARKCFTPRMIESRATALLDLGYLCHLTQHSEGPGYLALADDLRANGPDSEYALLTAKLTLRTFAEFIDQAAPA